jgi:CO/xanthine dehydrogenase FAD-binding subunit
MSFKIWNAATVGGNVCMSLPAGAMISLTAALEGVCTLWPPNGKPRQVPVVDFVTGMHTNVLQKGEVLRSILLPASALSKRFAMRQVSLTHHGRSAALIVATVGDKGEDFLLTISAATPRPVHLRFKKTPSASELRQAIDERLPPDAWFHDVHGSAPYKRHITFYLAEQIRAELT